MVPHFAVENDGDIVHISLGEMERKIGNRI